MSLLLLFTEQVLKFDVNSDYSSTWIDSGYTYLNVSPEYVKIAISGDYNRLNVEPQYNILDIQ